jgi:hypothetical protein
MGDTNGGVTVSNEVVVSIVGALSAKFDADVKMLGLRLTSEAAAAKMVIESMERMADKGLFALGQVLAAEQARSAESAAAAAAKLEISKREIALKEAEQQHRFTMEAAKFAAAALDEKRRRADDEAADKWSAARMEERASAVATAAKAAMQG